MRNPPKGESAEFVEALARGISVIECFDETHSEMALSEVARRTGMSPATARRSLHTLEALGYIYSVNKRFLLAPRILTLGSAYVRAAHIDEALMPELRRIVEQFGNSSSVGILDQGSVLYVAHLSEQRAARRIASVGVSYPAYATSMGRVLLAFAEPDQVDGYFKRLKPAKLTDQTETSIDRLRKILDGDAQDRLRHHGRPARLRDHRPGGAHPRRQGAGGRRREQFRLFREAHGQAARRRAAARSQARRRQDFADA